MISQDCGLPPKVYVLVEMYTYTNTLALKITQKVKLNY